LDALMPMFKAAITLFIVLDPIGEVPVFLSLTAEATPAARRRTFLLAWAVALGLMFVFIFAGKQILDVFRITLQDFQIGGGLLLLLIGLKLVNGGHLVSEHDEAAAGVIPIACPLLVGPGAITTGLVFVQLYGLLMTFGAVLLAFLATFIVLMAASEINRILGRTGTNILTRIMGILLAAIAVQLMRSGVIAVIRSLRP
jgi:multiple antibiotic resistance protein